MKVERKPKVICYLKVDQKNAPIYKYVKELEQYCHGKYEIEDWYIDIVSDKDCRQAPQFNRLVHEILESKKSYETIVVLDNNQISTEKEGVSLIKSILFANGIQIEPMQRYYREIYIPSMLDDIVIKYADEDVNELKF